METPNPSPEDGGDQTVPNGEEEEEEEEEGARVKTIQSHYLRCPSPNFSMLSESRFSMISGSDADSIFMEPIHLSSAIAAKQIINEELKPRGVRTESTPESMLEKAEHLMVEDLYNRVKDMIDDRSPYNTPCVLDIQRAMVQDRLEAPMNPVDEVWPNIFIGEKSVAVNKARLKRMGITHILNAAHGTGVYTGEAFYAGLNVQYMGIEVDDFADADLSPHFRTAAEFLDEALLTHKGKVLVDSMMGVSRSAVLVAAYLMIFHHMSIMEALTALRKKRAINPNEGFLKQLRQLNEALMEERDDDDDDTLSQCSVVDARARLDEEESMMGARARSIVAEEEEDGASVMSSVASSAAAEAALRSGAGFGFRNGGPEPPRPAEELELPGRREEDEDEDDVGSIIREWQRRNEKYQSDEWWEAQLLSDGEEEDGESLQGDRKPHPADNANVDDLESVTSEDVRAVKETLKRRLRRGGGSDSASMVSTASCSSYADLWKQRLKEIEEQAAARYRKKDDDDGNSESSAAAVKKTLDDDVESVMSDTSSMYNFCKRNKEKLTPLERWRIKRIQFGWNKKDGEGEGSVVGGGGKAEGEATPTPAPQDVNLTAYQSWKMKQGIDNKDEIAELSRGEDSATVKRRQHREEVLERSRKTLEESQSMCGWETESSLSGSTVPLSAFWAGAGVTGPPSVANDDNVSMLSGRSSVLSQARSARSQAVGLPQGMPQVPMVPVPMVQGATGEPMVNLASIQNWIANVVTETLMQKQGEMSSRAGSVLSFNGGPGSVMGPGSVAGRHGADDDVASMLSGSSYASQLGRGGGGAGARAESVLSAGAASSGNSAFGSRKKITTTSVPLYSLFQDQVNLRKLDSMDKEMKAEMRDKMAGYERKKITEDNKRSTLYKKKKPKEEEEEEEEEVVEVKPAATSKGISGGKTARSYGLSGRLNLSTALEKDKNTSIDAWLDSVRPPPRKPAPSYADRTEHGSSHSPDNADRGYGFRADSDSSPNSSPEPYYRSRRSPLDPPQASSSNGVPGFNGYGYRAASSYADSEEEREERHGEYSAKRRFLHHSQEEVGATQGRGGRRGGEEEEELDDVAAFLSQARQRSRARAEAENENDEILSAWRAQQESKLPKK